jgi:enamine deaminase RidA (YjgF/YER057c/UK114 family)
MRYQGLAKLPYDYAAVVPTGSMLFSAGACPLDAQGRVIASGDHRAQAKLAVENLLTVLDCHQAGPEHLVKTTIYVVGDRTDLVTVWDVVAGRLDPHRPPSTLLGVAVLGYQDQLVEIDGIAALPG